jgi:hypothetical protein
VKSTDGVNETQDGIKFSYHEKNPGNIMSEWVEKKAEGRYKCVKCKEVLSTQAGSKNHFRSCVARAVFKCEYKECSIECKRLEGLRSHWFGKHDLSGSVGECVHGCGRRFVDYSNKSKHERLWCLNLLCDEDE